MVNNKKRLSFGHQSEIFKSIGITPVVSNTGQACTKDKTFIDMYNSYEKTLSHIKNSLYRKASKGHDGHLRHFCLFHGDKSKGCRCDMLTRLERGLLHDYINYNYSMYKTVKVLPVSLYKFIYINRQNRKYDIKIYSDYDIEQVHLWIVEHNFDKITVK